MAQASTSYKSRTIQPVANKGAAASGNRYAAQATAAPSWLKKSQATDAARLSMQARTPSQPAASALPKNLTDLAKAVSGNLPTPANLSPLKIPSGTGTGLQSSVQQLANEYYQRLTNPPAYQTPQGTNILANAQDLQRNFIPEPVPPTPYQNPGFNTYAPPTRTVLPDTYLGQVQRLIERANASGRTLPDTIQGMLDRLGQQYGPRPNPVSANPWDRLLPDTLEGMLNRLIEQAGTVPGGPGGTGGGSGGDTGGGGGQYPQQPGIADIMRWLYGNIYWRGW